MCLLILSLVVIFIYLFGGLCRFQHCTGHITMGSWKGGGNQYIQFVRVLYCKLPTNGKQLPAFPLEAVPGTEARPQRWKVRVLPPCHRGPFNSCNKEWSRLIKKLTVIEHFFISPAESVCFPISSILAHNVKLAIQHNSNKFLLYCSLSLLNMPWSSRNW